MSNVIVGSSVKALLSTGPIKNVGAVTFWLEVTVTVSVVGVTAFKAFIPATRLPSGTTV